VSALQYVFGNVQVIDIGGSADGKAGRITCVRPLSLYAARYSPGSRSLSLRSLLFAEQVRLARPAR